MQGYREILTDFDLAQAVSLLAQAGLSLPAGRTYGLGFYEDGRLVACGFLADEILCGICVAGHAREGGVGTGLLSRLVLRGRELGASHFFIFTKASEALKFEASGFDLVAKTSDAALLEQGRPNYADWLAGIKSTVAGQSPAVSLRANLGSIVMNANPFTLGHEYLARQAALACERLLVFVVEEDVSVFPFAVRFDLVQKGLAGMGNILVLPAGPYMVSRASFPAYFTADAQVGAVHAALDSTIFVERVAADLGIGVRFVGTEPLDPVTAAYNAAMRSIFTDCGLELREMPRLENFDGIVSASKARAILQGDLSEAAWRNLAQILPPVTLEFLRSDDGAAIRQKLGGHTGRH